MAGIRASPHFSETGTSATGCLSRAASPVRPNFDSLGGPKPNRFSNLTTGKIFTM
jgi:hypothetical protein